MEIGGTGPGEPERPDAADFESVASAGARGVKWTAMSRLVVRGSQFVATLLLARSLGPAEMGLVAAALAVTGFLGEFNDGGLSKAIIRESRLSHGALAAVFRVHVAIGTTLALGLAAVSGPVAALFDAPQLRSLLVVLAGSFVLLAPGEFLAWLLVRDLRFRPVATADVASAAVWLVTVVALLASGLGVLAFGWSVLIRSMVRSSIVAALAGSHRSVIAAPADWGEIRDDRSLRRFATFQLGERTAYFIASNVDVAVVFAALGSRALGLYSVAYNLIIGITRVVNPIFQNVAYPMMSRRHNEQEYLRRAYVTQVRYISLASAPILALLAITAPDVLELLYGSEWRAAATALRLFAAFGLFYALRSITFDVARARGRADISFYFNMLAIVVLGGAAAIGASFGSISDVALALAVASFVILLPVDIALRRRELGTGGGMFGALAPAITSTCGLAATAAVTAWLVREWTAALPKVVLPALAGMAAFVLTFRLAWPGIVLEGVGFVRRGLRR